MKLSQWKGATVTTLSAAALATSLVTLSPESAQANDPYVEEIVRKLTAVAMLAGFNGRRLTHEPTIDTLRSHRKQMITLNLRSGVNYGLIGVCDSDCADIDLKLYDENYGLIDTDTQSDNTPVVSVVPRWTGRFYLEVDMETCQANYCYYGVGVFGQ